MTHAPATPRRPLSSLAVLALSAALTCGPLVGPASAAPVPVATAVTAASAVSSQPEDATVRVGDPTSFTATSDTPMDTVHWEVSEDGTTWTRVTEDVAPDGGTFSVYYLDATTNAMDGQRYRAVFTDGSGSVETAPALLTVVPTVTAAGPDSVHAGQAATFTATADDGATLPSGLTWRRGENDPMGGPDVYTVVGTGPTYTLADAQEGDGQYWWQASWTVNGQEFTSSTAYLNVDTNPWVTSQPGDTSGVAGSPISLTAHSSLSGATVRWMFSPTGNEDDYTELDGPTTDTLTLSTPRLSDSGWYKASFSTDDDYLESSAAHVVVTGQVPGAPAFTATRVGTNSVKVTWSAPSDLGTPATVTGYQVGWGAGQYGDGTSVPATAREHTFTGFNAGTFTFVVRATNAAGDSETASVPVVVPAVTPTSSVSAPRRTAGQSVVLAGTGAPGTVLSIERALPGQAWRQVGTTTVNALGRYAATLGTTWTATYRTRSADGRVSPGRVVAVDNAVTMTATRRAVRKYTLSGVVSPARRGQAVQVQVRKANGSYAALGTVSTDAAGRWSLTKTFPSSRTYTFRSVSADTVLNDPGSVTRSVAVR